MVSTQSLLAESATSWSAATSGPFLDACKDGSLSKQAFDTWLFQDYQFGKEFTRFTGSVLSFVDDDAIPILLGGIVAMDDELKWFKATLQERGVQSSVVLPTCQEYCAFLRMSATKSPAVQLTVLWAVEASYHESWKSHQPMAAPYDTYANRWSDETFSRYIVALADMADAALADQPEAVVEEAVAAFAEVCRLEKAFWTMVTNVAPFEA